MNNDKDKQNTDRYVYGDSAETKIGTGVRRGRDEKVSDPSKPHKKDKWLPFFPNKNYKFLLKVNVLFNIIIFSDTRGAS